MKNNFKFIVVVAKEYLLSSGLSNRCSNGGRSARSEILAGWQGGRSVVLGVHEADRIGEGHLGAEDALRIPVLHDLDLDTEDTLAEQDVADGIVNEIAARLTGMDHEARHKLHRLGTLAAELTADDNLNTLGTGLHDEVQDTSTGTADSQAGEQLVTERLSLGNSRQTTVLHLLGEELDGALGEAETLLDDGSQLADAAAVLTKDVLGAGGTDDDFGALGGDTDLDARVALLGEAAGQELVQLGVENTISDKLDVKR